LSSPHPMSEQLETMSKQPTAANRGTFMDSSSRYHEASRPQYSEKAPMTLTRVGFLDVWQTNSCSYRDIIKRICAPQVVPVTRLTSSPKLDNLCRLGQDVTFANSHRKSRWRRPLPAIAGNQRNWLIFKENAHA